MSMEKRAKAAGAVCLMAAVALTIALFVYVYCFPLPTRYTSAHTSAPITPLMGFAEDSVFNTGSAKELDALPGIGEVLSQRIIEGRSIFGDYLLPTELLLVKGIGPKTLSAMMEALDETLVPVDE